jgi:CheY-like chemotaxis protein
MSQPPPRAPVAVIVDDEPDVCAVVGAMVKSTGHIVLTAQRAQDALDILAAQPHAAVLVTDIVLGGPANGFELAFQARQLHPQLKVVYMSGYHKPPPPAYPLFGPLLRKPFRQSELEAVLRGHAC